jgi:hypothetical protein
MVTNREAFFKKHNIPKSDSLSIPDVARLSNMPVAALNAVYSRGLGAWGSNISSVRIADTAAKNPNTAAFPRSTRMTAPQWAMARIYSFVQKQKGTFYGADADIAKKYNLV